MTEETRLNETVESEADSLLQQNEFGTSLKQAREAAGISIAEVAEQLLISEVIIKAIEGSNIDTLPAATFTQGYIRSYARMLDLPADDIIEAYSRALPDSTRALSPSSFLPGQKTSNDGVIKVLSLMLVVAGFLVLGIWLYQTDFRLNKDQIAIENSDKISQSTTYHNENTYTDTLSVTPDQYGALTEEAYVSEVVNDQDVVSLVEDNEIIETSAVDNKEEVNQTENIIEPVINQPSIIEPSRGIGDDVITLSALGDSWCEIQDAAGQRLFYQLLKKDEEKILKGLAPFNVFLGNAPIVRIEMNNKIVNFDHLINSNSRIARLMIESDAQASSAKNR